RTGTRNDGDAEAELFGRWAPRVRLYGLLHLRNKHAADDLTKQVLMTKITPLRAARLREPDKLVSFMLGTCRMTVLDIRRGAQRKQRLLEQFAAELPVSAEPSPSVDEEQLARCVQLLKGRERTVIVMSFSDEKPATDLATFLR